MIRIVVFLLPIAVSFVAAWYLSGWMPVPDTLGARIARWLFIATVATIAMLATERVVRRALPLAALFSLTLVFPDATPSRFGVALRSMSARRLERKLADVDEHGLGDTPKEAAETVLVLVAALSRHDRLTRGHSERVRAYALLIGEEMELPPDELDRLRWAGLLHDVGKLHVPGEILNKPGGLTPEEFEVVKQHTVAGRAMVAPLAGWLGDSVGAVHEHHERWGGGGYPTGVRASELPLASRIVSVADAFDVMTSARSYKEAVSARDARAELERCAGSQFDPRVVRAMLNVSLGKLWRAMGALSWFTQLGFLPRALARTGPTAAAVTASVVSLVATGVVDSARDLGSTSLAVGSVASAPATMPDSDAFAERVADAQDGSGDASASAAGVPTRSAVSTSPGSPVASPTTTTNVLAAATAASTTPTTSPSAPGAPATSGGAPAVPTGTPTTVPTATATTIPPTAGPPPITTGPTTIPPTTIPPTTIPPTTIPPTTAVPPTTIPPTTAVPPTTTAPVTPATSYVLASPGPGDQPSTPVLALVADRAPLNQGPVPNYDTDRNGDPGLTILRTPPVLESTDPTGVQAWQFPAGITRIAGTIELQLWVASNDPTSADTLRLRAGLYDCDPARAACVPITRQVRMVTVPVGAFAPASFDLSVPAGYDVGTGRRLEIRIAVLNGSGNDARIAYDHVDMPARLVVTSPAAAAGVAVPSLLAAAALVLAAAGRRSRVRRAYRPVSTLAA